jgi:UDP-GlcNAc:undecaprenyl-phosphate GlcNAc-1-phosphate transferase
MLAIRPVKKLAEYAGAIDQPGRRKIHTVATPKLGGLAILAGILLALGIISFFYESVFSRNVLVILVGAVLASGLGLLDDIYSLQPPVKLLGQLLIAVIVVAGGIEISFLKPPFSPHIIELGFFAKIISLVWILIVMNIINLIDGLDGLAGGIVLISAASLFIISLLTQQLHVIYLLIAICGAVLGFLRFNFPPASIFMGDTGSLLLGYLLAVCSIEGVLKSATLIALAVPAISLLIPLLDMFLAIFRRARSGVHIFHADKGHIHHRLLHYNHSQKEAVLLIYCASILLNILAIALAVTKTLYSVLFLLVLIFISLSALFRLRAVLRSGAG